VTYRPTFNGTLLAAVVTVVVVADQLVKRFALARLEPGVFVPLLGPHVGWQLVFNPGAAFGLRLPPVVFPLVTILVVVLVVRSLADERAPLLVGAQGLVVGGAIGNVIDRVVRAEDGAWFSGRVIDFVAWGSFPRFNVADTAITVGVALIILGLLLEERRAPEGPS
jgi:signal peptidase II